MSGLTKDFSIDVTKIPLYLELQRCILCGEKCLPDNILHYECALVYDDVRRKPEVLKMIRELIKQTKKNED